MVKKYQQQNSEENKKSTIAKFDYILKKGEDQNGNIFYKIKWKDLPKEESSYEPIENLSPIKNEVREYDMNYLFSIREIEVIPKKVNFIKTVKKRLYCNVLFQRLGQDKNNANKPFIGNLYVRYDFLKNTHPKLLINYFEQYYKE